MAEPVKPTRRYDSPRRREQAAATRREILEAAQRLFERQGYAATTMAAIAAEAGVALKTVYVAFETKSGVLRALWHLLLRGDEEDVPVGGAALVPRGARGARPGAPAAAERAQLARRQGARRRAAGGDPQRGARRSRHRRRSGAASSPSSTATSARSSRPCTRRRRCGPASTSRARPTSSGRSTTRTCGTCSSASAAGRPRVRAVVRRRDLLAAPGARRKPAGTQAPPCGRAFPGVGSAQKYTRRPCRRT